MTYMKQAYFLSFWLSIIDIQKLYLCYELNMGIRILLCTGVRVEKEKVEKITFTSLL